MAKPKGKLGRNGYSPRMRHDMQRELTSEKKRRSQKFYSSFAELKNA